MSGPFYDEGRYTCRVVAQGIKPASTGKLMVVLTVQPQARLVRGPEGEEPDYCTQNYDRDIRLVVNEESEKQQEMMLKKLRYAGFTGTSFKELNLVGADVECEVKHREGTGEYAGKTFEDWDLCLPPMDRKPLEPLDTSTARKLDALFGKKLKDAPVAAQRETVPPSDEWSPPPPADEEVPF